MPKLTRDRLPKLRFHAASGLYVVVLSGEWHYLGADQAEALRRYDAAIQQWIARGRQPARPTAPESPTVQGLVAAYWEHPDSRYEQHGAPTSEVRVRKPAYDGLVRLFGDRKASAFTLDDYATLRDWWTVRELSAQTVKQYSFRIRDLFRWGARRGLVSAEVWYQLQAARGQRGAGRAGRKTEPVRPVPQSLVEATLPHLPPHIAEMVQVQELTGMRPGEICILRADDIDRSGPVWVYQPSRSKSEHLGHPRAIPIGPRAQALLGPRLEARGKDWLYPSRTGGHLKRNSYTKAIDRACRKAGLPHWHPHQLRHNAATLIRKTFGLDASQATLGHKHANVTQIYADLDLAKASEVASKIG